MTGPQQNVGNVPREPKIYHITHVANLPSILTSKTLWAHSEVDREHLVHETVGMTSIKKRRLHDLPVAQHGHKVGEYVPFYFCPRSIMLYLLHCGNHPELTYRGGQEPILHLEADLHETVDWAATHQRPWAFTKCNAATRYTEFFTDLDDLTQINWQAVMETDFRQAEVKEAKQAEFLVLQSFPWSLVRQVGVASERLKRQVEAIVMTAEHRPTVIEKPEWYY